MADVFSAGKRRLIMQAIRRKGTTPELLVVKALALLRLDFTCNDCELAGRPDVVVPAASVAIFVHGCFWHGHTACDKGRRLSKTRTRYWRQRIDRNKRRDLKVSRQLRKLGYSVYVVWECELRRHGLPSRLIKRLTLFRR